MRDWLLSVLGAALVSSLALALCPKGRVQAVTRFVCALVCMLSLVSPLLSLDGGGWLAALDDHRAEAETIAEQERENGENEQRIYIQQQCAAYILTEAQALGLSPDTVSVLARWDAEAGAWLPAYCTVDAPYHAALAETIERELGIAGEAQRWQE